MPLNIAKCGMAIACVRKVDFWFEKLVKADIEVVVKRHAKLG